MELTFMNPQYLWILLIIPFLVLTHFYGLKYSRKKAIKFANFEALSRVSGGYKLSMNLPLLLLRSSALVFLIGALTSPILWYEGKGGDYNYVIAIDASGSMLATDFSPNRLEAAKKAAVSFVDELPKDSQISVISFSGTPYVKLQQSSDFSKVKSTIANITTEYSSGTAIGDVIIMSANILLTSDRARSVILLSDGQSNVGTIIEKAINYANEHFITVNTIGMATTAGGKFTDVGTVSVLDDKMLKSVAENTGGKFYMAKNNNEILSAYKDIAKSSTKKVPFRMSLWLVVLTFLALSIEWVVVNTRFRSIP